MQHAKLGDVEHRFGEYGPGYVVRGPRTDFGVVQLRPGDEAENHYHAELEETFIPLEGEATMWIDCKDKYTLRPGDLYRAEPGEMHYFVNESDTLFRALFVKAPYNPSDVVPVAWVPGEPIPEVER